MSQRIHHHIVEKAGTLESFCLGELTWQQSIFDELLSLGAIYHNKKRCLINKEILAGDYLRLHTQPKRFSSPQNIGDCIVATESDFYILNKPAGLPTHATLDNYKENLAYILANTLGEKIFVTHRLDQDTSGLILLARNKDFQRHFNLALSEKKVTKYYMAVSEKTIPKGKYIHHMQKSDRSPRVLCKQASHDSQLCELSILKSVNNEHLILIKSGRTHQIRAQMAFLGAPIIGDTIYGGTGAKQLGLRAVKLSFAYEKQVYSYELS